MRSEWGCEREKRGFGKQGPPEGQKPERERAAVVGEGAAQDREREAKTGERAGKVPGKTGKVGSYNHSSGLLCYDLSVSFVCCVPGYK